MAKRRMANSTTLAGRTQELARIYRECRRNELDLPSGKALTRILRCPSGMIRDNDIVARHKEF